MSSSPFPSFNAFCFILKMNPGFLKLVHEIQAPLRLSCLRVGLAPIQKNPRKRSDREALGHESTHVQGSACL